MRGSIVGGGEGCVLRSGRDGFTVGNFNGGTLSDNMASENGDDDFLVRDFPVVNSAVFSNYTSTNNIDLG